MAESRVADVLITREDLEQVVGKALVQQLFQLAGAAAGTVDEDEIERTLENASSHATSIVRAAWAEANIAEMANDPAFRMHVAWIAMEFRAESRQFTNAADGKGKYWAQAERAEKWLVGAAKAQRRPAGEKRAGPPATVTSNHIRPSVPEGGKRFVFAKDSATGRPRGGF